TGHALLSTLHSRDAAGAITALRNLGIADREIADSLAFVIAQRLVRKLCTHCRKKEKPTFAEARWLRLMGENIPSEIWHPGTCEECHGSGYSGRTGVFEVWPFDEESYELVRNEAAEHVLRDHLQKIGVRSLLWHGFQKAAAGIT